MKRLVALAVGLAGCSLAIPNAPAGPYSCVYDSDCPPGDLCGPNDAGQGVCSPQCTSDADCPAGEACLGGFGGGLCSVPAPDAGSGSTSSGSSSGSTGTGSTSGGSTAVNSSSSGSTSSGGSTSGSSTSSGSSSSGSTSSTSSGGSSGWVCELPGTQGFAAQLTYPVGTAPPLVVTADFNGDGKLDLAVSNSGDDSVGILLGEGDGGFAVEVTFALGGTGATGAGPLPAAMAVGDFNGDGHPDLLVAADNSNYVWVLLGTGTGSFGAPATFVVGNIPDGLAVADFDGDGKADFAAANYGDNTVSVLHNQGDGGFATEGTYPVGVGPWTLAAGDLDGDGLPDLVVTNQSGNTVSVLRNLGDGGFAAQTTYAAGSAPQGLAVRDFTGDGKLDIAVANFGDGTLGLLVNQGGGVFAYQQAAQAGLQPFAMVAADFSGYGRSDLAVTDAKTGKVNLLVNQGDGGFALQALQPVGAYPQGIAAGDFNGDGRPDVAVANFNGNTVSVLLNQGGLLGTGSFEAQTTFMVGSDPTAVAVGDFNGDGQLDVVSVGENAASVSVLLATGTGSFGSASPYPVGAGPWSVAVADFDLDGVLDLAVTNYTSGQGDTVSILLGTGTGGFNPQTTFAAGPGPVAAAVGDFNEDGLPDLVVANANTVAGSLAGTTVSVLLNQGGGIFGSPSTFTVGNQPEAVAVTDFNGDGHLDLAVTNYADDTVSVLLGTGTGIFGGQVAFAVDQGPQSIAVADFNEDGHPDLAVADWGNGQSSTVVSVLLGLGDGGFGPQTLQFVGTGPASVAVGNFNGDDHIDLAAANYGNNGVGNSISVLLGLGDGSFGPQTTFAVGTGPFSVAVGDFNADGIPDLAVANDSTIGTVSVLLGVCR